MTIVGISFLLLSYGLFLFFTHWEAQYQIRLAQKKHKSNRKKHWRRYKLRK